MPEATPLPPITVYVSNDPNPDRVLAMDPEQAGRQTTARLVWELAAVGCVAKNWCPYAMFDTDGPAPTLAQIGAKLRDCAEDIIRNGMTDYATTPDE